MLLEILRLANPVPLGVPHSCDTDQYFDGYLFPRGAVIWINQYQIHLDPKYWPNPKEFDPTRFLDGEGKCRTGKIRGFLPFGIGTGRESE